MAATILTVAQQKGGAGKTTLAAQLAAAIANGGQSVAVMDVDPQRSLSHWHEMREGREDSPDAITLATVSGWRIGTEIDKLRRSHDWVIIDSPPHAETETKHALNTAALALIPIQPSPMDLWATQATLDAAGKERTTALVVLNRVPPRARVNDQVRAAIAERGLNCADSTLGNRTAFAASMMVGQGVTEFARTSPAADEICALLEEVRRQL